MHAPKKIKKGTDPNNFAGSVDDVSLSGYYDFIYDDVCPSGWASDPHCAETWQKAFMAARNAPTGPNMKAIRNLRSLIWFQTEYYIARTIRTDRTFLSEVQTEVCKSSTTKRKYFRSRNVQVVEEDMLEVARRLVQQGKTVAVLNMANAWIPGGGFRTGRGAQEENLHRRTDAFRFLEQQRENYPIPEDACLVSAEVTVLRGAEADGYPFLSPFRITLVSCAAVFKPKLTKMLDYAYSVDRRSMERKIAAIMNAVAQTGCDSVILSALGCGAFGNPPRIVAEIFRNEFKYTPVQNIIFSIIDDHNAGQWHNPRGNFIPFTETFRPM